MTSNRKLNMVFTRGNTTKTISLANPRQDITGAEVHSVMKDIVAKDTIQPQPSHKYRKKATDVKICCLFCVLNSTFTFAYCRPSAEIDWFLPPGCRKSCLPAY